MIRAPIAPTAAASVGVAMPVKIEPNTETISMMGGRMQKASSLPDTFAYPFRRWRHIWLNHRDCDDVGEVEQHE